MAAEKQHKRLKLVTIEVQEGEIVRTKVPINVKLRIIDHDFDGEPVVSEYTREDN
jgi:hypothetical protein